MTGESVSEKTLKGEKERVPGKKGKELEIKIKRAEVVGQLLEIRPAVS